ncbi:MAG: Rpn family recombination-promoting nuclease/putative transposase [Caldilineaceae bacterium]
MRFVDPKNDIAFKKIFGDENHKEILLSFLNAVLDLKGEQEIADVAILNPYQTPRLEMLKYTLLDLQAVDKRGVTFIVEMQVEEIEGYKKRFQYYAAKAYAGQIERGEEYLKLNQVIFIGILDFTAFDSKHYLSRHLLLNLETKNQDLSDIEFNFIELPKFKKTEQALTTLLDKWVYFIKHASRLDVIPENTNNPALQSAYDVAERFRWSKEELEVYDYWSMKLQDERGALTVAERRGLERGLEAGRKEGIATGEKAARIATARALLADGMEAAQVAKYTGLPLADIAAL